jgi:hypothetical protein
MSETIDGETLILGPDAKTFLHCNASSSLVWTLCNGRNSVQAIIDLLTAVYPEAADDIRCDIPEVLQTFAEKGMILWR